MSRKGEGGAATVFATALVGALVSFALGCAGAGSVVVAHRRAQAAADLAALAGAGAQQRGQGACEVARAIALRNGARLTRCESREADVVVTVESRTVPLLGHRYVLPAQARAGPASGVTGLTPAGVPLRPG